MARRRLGWIAGLICASLVVIAMLGGTHAIGATSPVIVTATVPSATNISSSGCPSWTSNTTSFGTVLPGTSMVTSSDCTLTFGSSDDTAMLKVSQSDSAGNAFYRHTEGELDTAWDTDGVLIDDVSAANDDYVKGVSVDPSTGKVITASTVGNGTNEDIVISRYSAAGVLDATFGTGGRVTIDLGENEAAEGLMRNSDGTYWVWGSKGVGLNIDGLLMKLTAGGALTTWDTDGWRLYNHYAFDFLKNVIVLSDGNLLFDFEYGDSGFFRQEAIKVNPATGNPVAAFGTAGTFTYPTTRAVGCDQFVEQPDGKILCGGIKELSATDSDMYVARLTAAGTLDTSFDGDGEATYSPSGPGLGVDSSTALTLLSDGKMILAGVMVTTPALAKVTSTGALDTTFDTDGYFTTTFSGASQGMFSAVIPTASGGFFVAGAGLWHDSNIEMVSGRLTSTLSWDPSVNDGAGFRRTDIGPGYTESLPRTFGMGVDGSWFAGGQLQERRPGNQPRQAEGLLRARLC